MESPLTPALALDYLRELSLDVRSAIVVDADGRRLAGAAEIEAPARALLGVPDAAGGLAVGTSAGWVFAERSPSVGVVVAAGPLVLPGLMRHDVGELVTLLDGARPGRHGAPDAPIASPPDALRALGDAVERALAVSARRAAEES